MKSKEFKQGLKVKAGSIMAAAMATTALVFGGPIGCKGGKQFMAIEEIAKTPEDIKELGFSTPEEFEEFKSIKEALSKSNISEENLKELKSKLEKILINVVKEKSAEALYQDNLKYMNIVPGQAQPKKHQPDEMKVIYIPGHRDTRAYQLIAFSNPYSTYFDGDGIGDRDFVCSNFEGATNKIDDIIADFISNIAQLQYIENPTVKDLKEAVNQLQEFVYYKMDFKDGNLVMQENQKLIEKIDEILNER